MRTAACITILLAGLSLWGQAPTGQVIGTVRDPAGLAVPEAVVVVTNQNTGQRTEVRSNAAGDYIAPALVPGQYTITVERTGFKQFIRKGVNVSALDNVRVDTVLEVGAVTQTVEVTADAPLVDTRDATVGTLIDDKRLVQLPMNGRDVISLVNLVPGVTRTALSSATSVGDNLEGANINGSRIYSTNMLLDGGSMLYTMRGRSMTPPPPDAVQEIKAITSGVTAEYGTASAVISAVTKSGTNTLHGSLWEYLRNNAFDARRFFDKTTAKLRYNQFGGTIGGPILKNRLFYFGSYQGNRVRREVSSTSALPPTTAERAGNLAASKPAPIDPLTGAAFPNATIPRDRFDAVALKLLDKIPPPNDPGGKLLALVATPTTADMVVGKFDYLVRSRDRISFRYYFDYRRGQDPFPNVQSPASNIPGYSTATQSSDMQTDTVNHVRTWTPALISTSRFSFSRFTYDEGNLVRETMAELGAKNFVNAGGPPRLPQVVINGRFSASPGKDRLRLSTNFDFAQDWACCGGA